MKTPMLRFAVSSLVIGALAVGCKPTTATRPATLSAVAPVANDRKAAHYADAATQALGKHKAAKAVDFAERAVAFAPRDAATRLLLGRAYLAAGRFASAETTFGDVLALDPSNGRGALNQALAQIALGRSDVARSTLLAHRVDIDPTDFGLALALAGDNDGAIKVLETAARADGASAKTRQNLALAYAMDGRWNDAHVVAAQDVPGNELPARLAKWAQFARPHAASDQVASLLGVSPVVDAGQPVQLALAPAVAAPVEAAAADIAPVPAPAPVEQASIAPITAMPAETPAPVAIARVEAPAVAAVPAGTEVAIADVPSAAEAEAAKARAAESIFRIAATQPTPMVYKAAARQIVRPVALVRAPVAPATSGVGNFVVQLGAFSKESRAETAWMKVAASARYLGGYAPSTATFRDAARNATLYRLSISGFPNRNAATTLCVQVKTAGGECFVRQKAGDSLAQWISSKSTRLASR